MLKQLTHVNVWVHDQDEALAFYTDKLGMELRDDVTVPEMGGFRWLSVGVPGQADVALALLPVPGRRSSTRRRRRRSRRSSRRAPQAASSSPPTMCRGPSRSSRGAGSSSRRSRRSSPTASTPGSATRRATRSAWRSSPRGSRY